jgi:hypothetical protein
MSTISTFTTEEDASAFEMMRLSLKAINSNEAAIMVSRILV